MIDVSSFRRHWPEEQRPVRFREGGGGRRHHLLILRRTLCRGTDIWRRQGL